jgi:putative thioredoxin
MTQQPFTRPGAIDLSGLKRPAGGAGQPAGQGAPAGGGGGAGASAGGASYWLDITEENFQATVEASITAPVLLAFYSASRLPESEQMARDLATVAEEYEGRFLAGLVDIDTQPAIAQAVQLQSVPFVFAVIDGRPQPLIQDVLPLDGLRTAINQVMQQLTTQGITGRHQPRQAAPAEVEGEDGEPPLDIGISATAVMPLARTTAICSLSGLTATTGRNCGLKRPISVVSFVSRTEPISDNPTCVPESIIPG